MRDRGIRYWLPSYLAGTLGRSRLRRIRKRQLTHLLFLVCDHFEPRHGARDPQQPEQRLRAWAEGYRSLQEDCASRLGVRPVHTWFYPPHHGEEHLDALARMVHDGLGEVELHYHHSGDTPESLRQALGATLATYHRHGLLLQQGEPPGRRFGFIHGDWALDNSAGGADCGVTGELQLLEELGCWGDLTMPSANRCQTRKINSIYYPGGSPLRPKSHDRGRDARAGVPGGPGLLLVQGPLGINLSASPYPKVENASLTSANWGSGDRIRSWIDCHVHVAGRPEWLFIKLHTHGALERDFDALFGVRARAMYEVLAREFNDGVRFRLHCVSARQAYNVIRAAEAGMAGDPAQYLDYELTPPVNSLYWANATHQVRRCSSRGLELTDIAARADLAVSLRCGPVRRISGPVTRLLVDAPGQTVELHGSGPGAALQLEADADFSLARMSGVAQHRQNGRVLQLIASSASVRIEYAPRLAASAGAVP